MSPAGLAGGYLADLVLGDPGRLHPVAGFGRLAQAVETTAYAPTRTRGAAYAGGLVAAPAVAGTLAAWLAGRRGPGPGPAIVLAAVTWACLGGRSLTREAARLAGHVERGELDAARAVLPCLCGRDPQALGAAGLSRAALESVAENTSDAVVGPLLWGAVAGPGGVVAHRAANTLDAMVGHRDERYAAFGWASARLDDALNWPAARLSVVLAAVCAPLVGGSPRSAWRTARRDGGAHPSPNAGRVEAAFAGALGVRLGGALTYGGVAEQRPQLGDGAAPDAADVLRANRLSLAVGAAAAVVCAVARGVLRRGGR